MDVFTFIDSTASLIKPFILCAEAGFKDVSYKGLFQNIREIGILGEKEMFISTKGVNTHKGALFILGILCAAIARCLYENKSFNDISNIIKLMTKGICENELESLDINNKKTLTHGERIYLKNNVKGIREEAEKGFPIIFNHSLKAFNDFSYNSMNDRLVYTLIVIMQYCVDTNIIFRNGIDCLSIIQNKAKNIISCYDFSKQSYKNAVDDLNIYLLENKISPGGSADILSATVFINEIKTKILGDGK